MKTHKVPRKEFQRAKTFRVVNGFWNPAMTPIQTLCGTEPLMISWDWQKVNCKRCVARRDNHDPK